PRHLASAAAWLLRPLRRAKAARSGRPWPRSRGPYPTTSWSRCPSFCDAAPSALPGLLILFDLRQLPAIFRLERLGVADAGAYGVQLLIGMLGLGDGGLLHAAPALDGVVEAQERGQQ